MDLVKELLKDDEKSTQNKIENNINIHFGGHGTGVTKAPYHANVMYPVASHLQHPHQTSQLPHSLLPSEL